MITRFLWESVFERSEDGDLKPRFGLAAPAVYTGCVLAPGASFGDSVWGGASPWCILWLWCFLLSEIMWVPAGACLFSSSSPSITVKS